LTVPSARPNFLAICLLESPLETKVATCRRRLVNAVSAFAFIMPTRPARMNNPKKPSLKNNWWLAAVNRERLYRWIWPRTLEARRKAFRYSGRLSAALRLGRSMGKTQATAFRFRRQPSRHRPPRLLATSGRAAAPAVLFSFIWATLSGVLQC